MPKLITIEGIDGSGKSTQAKLLYDYLVYKEKIETVLTKEPGSLHNEICGKIRELAMCPDLDVVPQAVEFLYMADCVQHIEKVVKPALLQNKIVISDRSIDSHIVYGEVVKRIPSKYIKKNMELIFKGVKPDLTIYLDITPEEAIKRISSKNQEFGKPDRIEKEGIDLLKKLHCGYRIRIESEKIGRNPREFIEINGMNGMNEVFDNLIYELKNYLIE